MNMVAMGKSMEGGNGRKVGDGIFPERERDGNQEGTARSDGGGSGRGEETGWGNGVVAGRIA